MNNFALDINISELSKASSAERSTRPEVAPIGLSFSTVASLFADSKAPPSPMESGNFVDANVAVTQARTNDLPDMVRDVQERLDQLRQTPDDEWARIKEELRAVFVMLNDLDGDGIPDDYDKHPGETVANVAARINKIGKYTVTDDNKMKIFSTLKTMVQSLDSLLNKISAMAAAASSSFKPMNDTSASDRSDGEESLFSLKKVDKEHK